MTNMAVTSKFLLFLQLTVISASVVSLASAAARKQRDLWSSDFDDAYGTRVSNSVFELETTGDVDTVQTANHAIDWLDDQLPFSMKELSTTAELRYVGKRTSAGQSFNCGKATCTCTCRIFMESSDTLVSLLCKDQHGRSVFIPYNRSATNHLPECCESPTCQSGTLVACQANGARVSFYGPDIHRFCNGRPTISECLVIVGPHRLATVPTKSNICFQRRLKSSAFVRHSNQTYKCCRRCQDGKWSKPRRCRTTRRKVSDNP